MIDRREASPAPRWLVALAAALVVAGIGCRVANLGRLVVWYDEVHTWFNITGRGVAEVESEARAKGLLSPADLARCREIGTAADTVRYLVQRDTHQTPGYPLLARAWARAFGSDPGALRALSAILSVLALPLLFRLCAELFASRAVAHAAVGLAAVSPFFVHAAHDARAYALWTVAILASSLLLLRALRVGGPAAWALYALATAAMLYTHLFALAVIPGHGIFVLASERERRPGAVRAFAAAACVAVVTLSPWIYVVATHRATVDQGTVWLTAPVPLSSWAARAAVRFARIFADFETWMAPTAVVLVPVLAAIAFWRHGPRRARAFVFALGAPIGIALAGADLALGGSRFLVVRYQVPLVLAAVIAVAYLFADRTAAPGAAGARRAAYTAALAALAALGLASSLTIARSEAGRSQWHYTRESDRIIAGAGRPVVVIAERSYLPIVHVVELGYYVPPETRFLLVAPDAPEVPTGFASVFAIEPSPGLRRALEARGHALELADPVADLWWVGR